jgi:hypothetical protein
MNLRMKYYNNRQTFTRREKRRWLLGTGRGSSGGFNGKFAARRRDCFQSNNAKIASFGRVFGGGYFVLRGMRNLTELTICGVLCATRVGVKEDSHRKAQIDKQKQKR